MSILKRCAFSVVTGPVAGGRRIDADTSCRASSGRDARVQHRRTDLHLRLPDDGSVPDAVETSFDPKRGHDRTLNEFFAFERLITSKDDWVVTRTETRSTRVPSSTCARSRSSS